MVGSAFGVTPAKTQIKVTSKSIELVAPAEAMMVPAVVPSATTFSACTPASVRSWVSILMADPAEIVAQGTSVSISLLA